MTYLSRGAFACLTLMWATFASAGVLVLEPASPQPGGLKPGLKVVYAYPSDVRNLRAAERAVAKWGKVGPPLTGLDYSDTEVGDRTLTSNRAENVAAGITGYVKFDKPGVYTIDFLANDGVKAIIGGQQVVFHDERSPCDPTFSQDVQVPKAGWYPVNITFFQRSRTSCLHMRMGPQGASRLNWMPNSAFGH